MIILLILFIILSIFYAYKYYTIKINIEKIDKNLDFRKNKKSEVEAELSTKNKSLLNLYEKYNEMSNKLMEKNERIDELKENYGKLLSNLSHDLRTPLTSIIGYLNLLDIKDEEQKKILDIAVDKAYFLNNLVEKFYQLSLINEKNSLDFENFDLVQLIYQTSFNYFDKFKKIDQEIEIKLPQKYIISSNKNSFESILTNILDNMYKYSRGNNKIELEDSHKMKLIFSNDIDYKAGQLNYLFERSKVLDPSRKNATGLGLSIVKAHLDKLFLKANIFVKDKKFYLTIEE